MRRRLRERRGDTGAVVVETALVIPVLLMLLIGIMVFGLRMVYAGVAENAASKALRMATIPVGSAYPSEAAVRAAVEGLDSVQLLGAPSCPASAAPGCRGVEVSTGSQQGAPVTVTVRYHVPVLRTVVGLWPFGTLDRLASIERTAEGRLE